MGHLTSQPITRTGFPNLTYSRLDLVVLLLNVLLKATLFSGGLGTGAADTTGFVSLDCGGTSGTYTVNGLTWTPDDGFGLDRVSQTGPVDSPLLNAPIQYSTIRYFPGNQSKYCYTFNASEQVYLVRAAFWLGYGDIPFSMPNPGQISFQLIINSDLWDDVSFSLPQTNPVVKEVYVQNTAALVSVCLAGHSIGLDTPFISSLELRPLLPVLLAVQRVTKYSQALFLHSRVNYGSSTGDDIRYPDDQFDRIWTANTTAPVEEVTGGFTWTNEEDSDYLPAEVLRTALLSADNATLSITVTMIAAGEHPYFYTLYFFEVSEDVSPTDPRAFTVTTSYPSSRFDPGTFSFTEPYYLQALDNLDFDATLEGGESLLFMMEKLPNATYGPLITAMEVFRISDQTLSLGANTNDVLAIDSIKRGIDDLDGWNGDPCLPYAFNWLSCSNETRPRVVSLDLSNHSIMGEIPSNISSLTSLIELDMHDNKLNGSIPEFLAELPSLRTLNLQNNNLSGAIPTKLLNKVNLNLSIAGNPYLCDENNNNSYCLTNSKVTKKSHASLVGGIVGGIVGGALILLGLFAYLFQKKRRHERTKYIGMIVLPHTQVVQYANQARCFTYKEIQTISNMFTTKIGQGSFGLVYYGLLSNEVRVALKVLEQSSTQGPQQFLNEVRLLSRVHHKNLVRLIGYCIEEKLVLAYEYMSNGSLHDFLLGKSKRKLTWLERLSIIVGSAEGLEYLHKSCTPTIIHRDIKPSNILLNDEMVAKISDFGISRVRLMEFGESSRAEMVTQVQGSYGYLDPETFLTQKINYKSDVYAFGVVLLQVVTGQSPIVHDGVHISEWVQTFIERGDIRSIVDPSIANDNYNLSSMWKMVEIAMRCVHNESRMRPDMSEVSSEVKLALSLQLQNQDSSGSHP